MIKIYTVSELSYEHLGEIENVRLTNRQIDVVACIIGRQKRKVICKILDISLSTFIEHLRKIKESIRYSNRNKQIEILEFLETSKQYQYLKNHYIKLLIQHLFEKTLYSIASQKLNSKKYVVSYNDKIDKNNLLNKKIRRHLKLAGVNFEVDGDLSKYSNSQTINIIPVGLPLKFTNEESIYIKQSYNGDDGPVNISYYNSLFELFGIIFDKSIIKILDSNFNYKKLAYEDNLINSDIYLIKINENDNNSPETRKILGSNSLSNSLFSINIIGVFRKYKIYIMIFFAALFIFINTNKVNIFFNKNFKLFYSELMEHKLIYYLPVRNKKFVERKNTFKIIKDNLNKYNMGIVVQAIVGTGGIGKTQLALEYAYRAIEQDKYDAILWIAAENDSSINNSYSNFSSKMKINVNKLSPKEIRETVYMELLDKYKVKKVLFILDNVPSRKNIEQYLKELHNIWPINLSPHILITSRSQHWIEDTLILDILSTDEAILFVKKNLPNSQHGLVINLIKALHSFPLALIQAIGYIKQHTNIAHYLTLYSNKKKEYLDILPEGYNQYEKTVWKTVLVTLDKLSDTAKEILYLSSYLSPDDISLDLFEHLSIEQRSKAIQELRNHSLIILTSNRESFKIHRILQEIIRLRIQDKPIWKDKVIQMAYQVIKKFDNKNFKNIFKNWLYHITILRQYMDKDLKTIKLLNNYGDIAADLDIQNLSDEFHGCAMDIKTSLLKGT